MEYHFLFILTGMYHVFLVVKDGFFHIKNLALSKIETGMNIQCTVDLQSHHSYYIFQPKINIHSYYAITAIEKMDEVALKEVRYKAFCMLQQNNFFEEKKCNHISLSQLQSVIKIDFCCTRDYHDEGCSTAVMFSLGHEIHLMVGVRILTSL